MAEMDKPALKKLIIGYTAAVVVCIGCVITVVCGQILGDRIPAMEVNCIRFALQLILSVLIVIVRRKNPRVSGVKVIAVLCISTVATFASGVFFILSSWYLPAAVVDGILENVIIALAAITAIFMKRCNIILPIAVFTSLAGNLLLLQPPLIFPQPSTPDLIQNNTTQLNCTINNQTSNQSLGNDTDINVLCKNMTNSSSDMETLYGFIYSALLGFVFWIHEQINVPYLVPYADVDVIFFWISIGSFPLGLIGLFFASDLILPTEPYDIFLMLMLSFSVIACLYAVMVSVVSISPMHTALVLPLAVVMLFVLQKTVLKNIHPGPSNWMEYFGLVLVIAAILLPAFYDFVKQRLKSKKKEIDEKSPLLSKEESAENQTP